MATMLPPAPSQTFPPTLGTPPDAPIGVPPPSTQPGTTLGPPPVYGGPSQGGIYVPILINPAPYWGLDGREAYGGTQNDIPSYPAPGDNTQTGYPDPGQAPNRVNIGGMLRRRKKLPAWLP